MAVEVVKLVEVFDNQIYLFFCDPWTFIYLVVKY